VAKLHKEGKLKERYSAHDLRHAYAVRLYAARTIADIRWSFGEV